MKPLPVTFDACSSSGRSTQGSQEGKQGRPVRVAILFSGRGSNMEAILREVKGGKLGGLCEVVLALSNRPDAPGLQRAAEFGVPTEVLESAGRKRREYDRALVERLEHLNLDYIVLAGFMRILTEVLIDRYPDRIINIHPADTACHQGLGGYEWAFSQGLSQTWVTVHYVDGGLDTGRVIAKRRVDLAGASSLHEVEHRGLAVERQFYSDCLRSLFLGEPVPLES